MLWIQSKGEMRKLQTAKAARLVKQKNSVWYIVWYSLSNPPERFRFQFNLNTITDIPLRQKWADAILARLNEAYLTGVALTPDDVSKVYQPADGKLPPGEGSAFLEHVERFIELRENVLEYGTVKVFRTCLNNLKGYAAAKLKKECPDFSDFDTDFPLRFQGWCYAPPRGHSKNYVAKLFDVLRQFLRDAEEHSIETGRAWKTKKYVLTKTPVDEIALTFEEVEKLAAVSLPKNLEATRDVFVFACLTGLRFSDVTRINSTHIIQLKRKKKDGGVIDAVKIDTKKTGEKVIVPLHPMAWAILERHKGSLPVAPCNQVFNRNLKEIGQMAAITEGVSLRTNVAGKQKIDSRAKFNFISTHTARRTFATYAYMELAMPVVLIMKITGHRTEREFFKYIRISQERAAVEMAGYMV